MIKRKLGLTQRVMLIDHYHERRDGLDQRWWFLSYALHYLPIPLPNLPAVDTAHYLDALNLSAIIITGGDSLHSSAKERDTFELALISWAIKRRVPVVGICRGMQIINHYFGGSFVTVTEHVATKHHIEFYNDWKHLSSRNVNSYHHFGIYPENLAKDLSMTAQHADKSIEAFIHHNEKIAGIMWHPERETPLISTDIELLTGLLG